MPGQSQKRIAKFSAEGASDIRGALKEETEDKPVVKQERLDYDTNTTTLLRNTIIAKRRNMGLDVDMKHLFQESSVKHELTPAELEKKERRKEQNRRAARKCRQKKKFLQAVVGDDFQKMVDDNKQMEKEIRKLRAEKASLEKTLADHLGSGSCKNIKAESPGCAVVPSSPVAAPTIMPLSPSPSPSTSLYSTASPRIATDPVSPPAATNTSTMAQPEIDSFNSEAYLQDLGLISPDQTFMDISEILPLDELDNEVIAADIPSRLTPPPPYSQPSLPEPSTLSTTTTRSPLFGSTSCTAADPMASLKTLMPAKACDHSILQLNGSASPLQDAGFNNHHHHHHHNQLQNQDRLSVSSSVSDWSGLSDRSQGFAVVPTGMESPLGAMMERGDSSVGAKYNHNHHASSTTTLGSCSSEPTDDLQEADAIGYSPASQLFWSHGLAAPDTMLYYGEGGTGGLGEDEEDDDVFFQSVHSTGSDEKNIFQQFARRQ